MVLRSKLETITLRRTRHLVELGPVVGKVDREEEVPVVPVGGEHGGSVC